MKKIFALLTLLSLAFLFCGCAETRTLAEYTVQPGDCWWQIAHDHDMSIDQLTSINNMTDKDTLYPGQTLMVFVSADNTDNTDITDTADTTDATGTTYTTTFTNTTDIIIHIDPSYSGLPEPTTIQIGSSYSAPTESPEEQKGTYYTIEPGDGLILIAQKFREDYGYDITSEDIIEANPEIQDAYTVIHPGQIIFIPEK